MSTSKTILIIDDDYMTSTHVRKLLRLDGYYTVNAETGAEGIRTAKNMHPDLILCDIVMPGMTGYEVLEQLQQDPSTANIPFVFLSAKSSDKDIRLGIKLGSDSYLTKPIDKSELLAVVNSRLASVDSQPMGEPVASTSILDRVRWIYQNVVTEKLGARYSGWTAAIEPDSGRCFVGYDLPSAHEKAHRSMPGRVFFYQKIYPKNQSINESFCDLVSNLSQANSQPRSQQSRELCLTA